jgi:hypothetical protein
MERVQGCFGAIRQPYAGSLGVLRRLADEIEVAGGGKLE